MLCSLLPHCPFSTPRLRYFAPRPCQPCAMTAKIRRAPKERQSALKNRSPRTNQQNPPNQPPTCFNIPIRPSTASAHPAPCRTAPLLSAWPTPTLSSAQFQKTISSPRWFFDFSALWIMLLTKLSNMISLDWLSSHEPHSVESQNNPPMADCFVLLKFDTIVHARMG